VVCSTTSPNISDDVRQPADGDELSATSLSKCRFAINPEPGTGFKSPIMRRTNANVVSVGENRELLLLRDAVLKSAGFKVFTTDNENEALARISGGDCGVLRVCYSASLPHKQSCRQFRAGHRFLYAIAKCRFMESTALRFSSMQFVGTLSENRIRTGTGELLRGRGLPSVGLEKLTVG
jgi:hypothetical protein